MECAQHPVARVEHITYIVYDDVPYIGRNNVGMTVVGGTHCFWSGNEMKESALIFISELWFMFVVYWCCFSAFGLDPSYIYGDRAGA